MVKFLLKSIVIIGILSGIGYAAYGPVSRYIAERNKPRWRTVAVDEGSITRTVNATGKVRPTKLVQVGSFVSGPIKDLFVEFNQEVKQGDLLARIDPQLFAANVARDEATLASRIADLERVKALLQQARNDEKRANALRDENVDFIALTELDQVKFNRMSLEAQLTIANASIKQADATLVNSQANLDYCEIRAPEDGMIIDRKVEPGQTLAAQFTTPEMFVVGVGMREKMYIMADVDESEIGLIREAADSKQPVTFAVTAYPDEKFTGTIEEVRFSAAELQTVVTYPVVVGSPNPELKLLPGMTADLSFQIEKKEKIVRVPKAALRFFPPDKKYVRPEDHGLVEGTKFAVEDANTDANKDANKKQAKETTDDQSRAPDNPTQSKPADVKPNQNEDKTDPDSTASKKKRHVWKIEGELLRAVEIRVGLSDHGFSELISGDLKVGDELVTGLKAKDEK